MRPLLVLSLVIVAVAVLFFALFTIDGDSDADPTAAVGIPEADSEVVRSTPDAKPLTPAPDRIKPAPSVESNRTNKPRNDQRVSVGSAREVFDNALVGRVLDPEGAPLAGAKLKLTEGGIPAGMLEIQRVMGTVIDENAKVRTATSNEDGQFRFRNLEPGNYSLLTKHDNFSPHQDQLIAMPPVGEVAWDISMQEGLIIQGYVRSVESTPVVGAELSLNSGLTPALFAPARSRQVEVGTTVLTDSAGYYQFRNIAAGASWHLSASAPGFGTETKRNLRWSSRTEASTIDFRLGPGKIVAGVVIAPDRSPIAGALVRVIGYQQPQTLSSQTIADQTGRFSLDGLVPGKYAMIVEAEGWGIERLNHIEAPDEDLEVEMTEQGSVMGRVIAARGAAVTSFKVTLHKYIPQTAAYGQKVQEKKIDSPEGSFTLQGVTEGQYAVKVSAQGFAESYSENFEVIQGLVTTDILVRMNQGGSITGIVLDAETGKPVVGASVSTQDNNFQDNPLIKMFRATMPRRTTASKARTGNDGRFEIAMLAPELYQVQIRHPSFPEVAVNNLRVVEGDATDLGSVRLHPGSTVRGIVYDSAGSPLAGSTVQLISTNNGQMKHIEGRTGSDGRYVLRNVPEGSYKLAATGPSESANPFQAIVDMKNSEILFKVARGEEYTQDLNLGG